MATPPSLFDEFKGDIDVHPSISEAAMATIPEILQTIQNHFAQESIADQGSERSEPEFLIDIQWFFGNKPKPDDQMELTSLVSAKFSNARVRFVDHNSHDDSLINRTLISFCAEMLGSDGGLADEMRSMMGPSQWPEGIVRYSIEGNLGGLPLTTIGSRPFENKPWVADQDAYLAYHGVQDWIIAHSEGTQTTPEEAFEDAVHQAVQQIGINQLSRKDAQDKLTKIIKSRIADEFHQGVERPYGTFYRTYILLDNQNKNLLAKAESLQDQERRAQVSKAQSYRREHRQKISLWMATPMLFIVIYTLASVGNRLSRGFYAKRIHVVGVTAVVLLAATVIALTA
ncbi:MAG: hypothetical protein AAF664_08865 [Planctomycetota bacterium]